MKQWYRVSLIGWCVTLLHLALALVIISGLWVLDPESPAIQLFYGAFYIECILLLILLYAKYARHKLFQAKK